MSVTLIYASDAANGIGKDGKLPWPEDKVEMKHFRKTTMGHTVIMGYRTWLHDLNCKPLKGRTNIVIIQPYHTVVQPNLENLDDQTTVKYITFENAVNLIKNNREVYYVIGGAETYKRFEPYADCILHSRTNRTYVCDTYYKPQNFKDKWVLEQSTPLPGSEFTVHEYSHI